MSEFDHLFNSEAPKSESEIEMENMIKKLQIEMSGGKVVEFNSKGIELPPEIESEFLDAILEFEKFKKNAKFIKIKDLCNIESLKNENELTSDELILELDTIKGKLRANGVEVSSVKDIEDKAIYRLIREKILDVEVPDIKIKGMISNFMYEDFYRDEEVEVDKMAEFFKIFFNISKEKIPFFTKNANTKIDELKKLFKEISIHKAENTERIIKKTVAYVTMDVQLEGEEIDEDVSTFFEGELKLKLKKSSNNWRVDDFWLPL